MPKADRKRTSRGRSKRDGDELPEMLEDDVAAAMMAPTVAAAQFPGTTAEDVEKPRKKSLKEERRAKFLAKLGEVTGAAERAKEEEQRKAKEAERKRRKTESAVRRRERKKRKAEGVSVAELIQSLNETAVPEVAATNPLSSKMPKKMTPKMKAQQIAVETRQFMEVSSLPAFQANPLAAIKQHLKNQLSTSIH